jgi:short subunit dehydrogenase-like uncharacterized protein
MSDKVGNSEQIVVYGATGFTGGLIARELRARSAGFVLAGRNRRKLEALAEELGDAPVVAVSLDDSAGLREMLGGCSVAIGAAGPFCLHAEPLVAAAAETGTHYLDTTGEQPFIRMVFEKYGERAAKTEAALVSGMGFDYAPGDLLAALTAEGMGPLDELTVAYHVEDFAPTHGTGLSALEMLAGGDVVYADGDWRPAPRSGKGGRWRFAEPIGEQPMLRYPAGEQITVPRHVDTRSVRTVLNGMVVPPRLMPLAVAATPLLGAAMRTPLRKAAGAAVRRMPAAPSEKARKKSTFVVECEARAGSQTRRGVVRGTDVYGLTAASLALGAQLCADRSFNRRGALAPAQAFDPAPFLGALDLEVAIDPLSPPR